MKTRQRRTKLTITLVGMAVFMICAQVQAGLTDGLVSHWQLDDGEGITTVDLIGGNDGTLINEPAWVTGHTGNALDFDGQNDYVDMGDQAELENFSQVTMSAWIYWSGEPGGSDHIAGKERVYKIAVVDSHLKFLTYNNWEGTILTSSASITQNTWTHVAATYDGSIKYVYINGLKDQSYIETSGDLGSHNRPFTLGAYLGESSHWEGFFSGLIDDVRLYDRALNSTEIADLYAIPEPTTLLLLGLGAVILRRKR
jgi:hypothetical protein